MKAPAAGIALALAALLAGAVSAAPTAAGPEETLVHVSSGPLRGGVRSTSTVGAPKDDDKGYRYFLGIPYAEPPVGQLRWRSPQPFAHAWSSARSATSFGADCMQYRSPTPLQVQSEDCLFVNVWTPRQKRLAGKKLPVLVFVHGGSFKNGAGSVGLYNGGRFVEEQDVVVVNLNYRMGPFGFLASKELAARDGGQEGVGNWGLQDIRLAIEWVKREIGAFGGDADKITVSGQSAGAILLSYLGFMNKGLFHRAIFESGTIDTTTPRAVSDVQPVFNEIAKGSKCAGAADVVACLMDASSLAILAATDAGYGPVVDGKEIPSADFYLDPARAYPFDLLIGNTLDEGSLFVTDPPKDNDSFIAAINDIGKLKSYPAVPPLVPAVYPLENYPSPEKDFWAIFGDLFFACPVRREARRVAGFGPRTFFYRWEAPMASALRKEIYHSMELNFVFGNGVLTSKERALSHQAIAAWASFVTNGNPGAGWKPYSGPGGYVERFTSGGVVAGTDDFEQAQCDFWDEVLFASPAALVDNSAV